MTTIELIERGIGHNCLSDAYDLGRADVIDEELQSFAQWLWDSHYLNAEAFTIKLVEQYKMEQLKF